MTDTRAAFESHFQLSQRQAKKDNSGEYINPETKARWEGWQVPASRIAELERCLLQMQNANIDLTKQLAAKDRFGYALAMRVLQSELYLQLDDTEFAECEAFIQRGLAGLNADIPSGR